MSENKEVIPIMKSDLKGKLVFKGQTESGANILANIQIPVRGLSVFRLDTRDNTVVKVEVDKDGQDTISRNVGYVMTQENCYYVQALNLKNAIKKFTPR